MKVITIGRELGSGGRTIGKRVAEALDIPYYDRELIDRAAKHSGLAVEAVEENDQMLTRSFLYDLAMGTSYGYLNTAGVPMDVNTQVFIAQREAILEFARNPCVLVGRCADYILRDKPELLRVFVYADTDARVRRAVEEYGMAPDRALKEIAQSDRRRARHYEEFTDGKWGARENYDLMINSSRIGIDEAVRTICELAR